MAVREQVLSILEAQQGKFVSGEALAEALSVSRAAVWKAIAALRAEGFPISAGTNRGYRLDPDTDVLTAEGVARALSGLASSLRIEKRDCVTSTNLLVRERAASGEPAGLVLLAEAQTEGRGRKGRSFLSPCGTGLYMSLLLRPDCEVSDSLFLTTAAAVAVAHAVEAASGQRAEIKWVNDVCLNGRKVCGILTEGVLSVESGGLDFAVVGIGVNVYAPPGGFPPELSEIAGVVSPTRKGGLRARIAASILNEFCGYAAELHSRAFLTDYKARQLAVGRWVTVLGGSLAGRRALVRGVDDDCRLLVRFEDGTEAALCSGEISMRVEK